MDEHPIAQVQNAIAGVCDKSSWVTMTIVLPCLCKPSNSPMTMAVFSESSAPESRDALLRQMTDAKAI